MAIFYTKILLQNELLQNINLLNQRTKKDINLAYDRIINFHKNLQKLTFIFNN